jgi:hypothetical protein
MTSLNDPNKSLNNHEDSATPPTDPLPARRLFTDMFCCPECNHESFWASEADDEGYPIGEIECARCGKIYHEAVDVREVKDIDPLPDFDTPLTEESEEAIRYEMYGDVLGWIIDEPPIDPENDTPTMPMELRPTPFTPPTFRERMARLVGASEPTVHSGAMERAELLIQKQREQIDALRGALNRAIKGAAEQHAAVLEALRATPSQPRSDALAQQTIVQLCKEIDDLHDQLGWRKVLIDQLEKQLHRCETRNMALKEAREFEDVKLAVKRAAEHAKVDALCREQPDDEAPTFDKLFGTELAEAFAEAEKAGIPVTVEDMRFVDYSAAFRGLRYRMGALE